MTASIPDGIRDIDVLGFSAGSYTGLAIHKILEDRLCVWHPDTLTDLSYNIILIDLVYSN